MLRYRARMGRELCVSYNKIGNRNDTRNMVCDFTPEMSAALVSHLISLLKEKLRQRNKKSARNMVCYHVLRMLW